MVLVGFRRSGCSPVPGAWRSSAPSASPRCPCRFRWLTIDFCVFEQEFDGIPTVRMWPERLALR